MKQYDDNKDSLFIKAQLEDEWDDYRYSGSITADCLSMLEERVASKTSLSLKDLDILAEEFFNSRDTIPVFKDYRGFPASVCMSVNHQLVHGIPTDRKLQEGDVISFDTGCNYRGAITDSALTCIYGEAKSQQDIDLVQATKECLSAAIKAVSLDGRVGVVGHAIFHAARKKGYKVIERYTGHGISRNQVHSDPPILNKDDIDNGIRFQKGMIFAIEPLLVIGNSTETEIDNDKWTVLSKGMSAHFEHSILMTDNGPEILTQRK